MEQVGTISITNNLQERISEHVANVNRNKGAEEILTNLDIDCGVSQESIEAVKSFQTTNVSSVVANSISSGKNIIPATEYLVLLYTTVREEEKFEEFEELYFGMKDIDDFMEKKDGESISFGGIVSGFTRKRKAVQSLFSNGEGNRTLSGVLFRVQDAKGYRIGEVDEETDEVLFELGSAFKVESVREVTKGKYFVVDLSFVSPNSENDMIKL